jgi:thiol-disulfide isomerase/thioredoxin
MDTYPPLHPGDALPAWHLLTLDGQPAPPLADFRGHPLLVLFWGLGCPACKGRALPFTRELRRHYPALSIVGVHTHLEGPKYSPAQIEEMVQLHKLDYPMYQDADHPRTYHLYRAEGTPHWILADAEGRLLRSVFGSMPGQLQRLDYLLREMADGS